MVVVVVVPVKDEGEGIITSKNYEQMQKYNHLQYYDSTNTLLENEVLRCGRQVACIYALLETVVPTKSCLSETLTCVEKHQGHQNMPNLVLFVRKSFSIIKLIF